MVDEATPQLDPIAETALTWIMREHEWSEFDDAARAELATWLAASPAHRQAHDRASRIWLLAGLVPPASGLEASDDVPSADE